MLCIFRRIHKAVYGQLGFDAELMLRKYREHNATVLEYFKDRPEDLLIMDMGSKDAHWGKLCAFLGVAVPDCAYPTRNVAPQAQNDFAI